MKILFIHNHYQFEGGEDTAVQLEAELLMEKGHDVKVVTFYNKNIKGWAITSAINAIYNSGSKKVLDLEIESFHPDVIHVHNFFFSASPSVFFSARALKVPVVFTLHNYRLICCNALLLRDNKVCELCVQKKLPFEGIRYKCYRNSALQSAMVTAITGLHKILNTWQSKIHTYITLTEFARQRFLGSSLNIMPHHLKVLPNFVRDREVGKFPREKFFLFVGRIAPEKGVSLLLECFARLPDQKLVVAGDGPEKEKLTEQYRHCTNIIFTGQLEKEKIMKMMQTSQALLFPSICYEGLPFTIIEAFATGTPVIASNIGAMAYLITDGYNGLHFAPNDLGDLQDCVSRFASEVVNDAAYYDNARKTFEENYSEDIHYQGLMDVYKKTIEEAGYE